MFPMAQRTIRPFSLLIGLHLAVLVLAVAFLVRQKGQPRLGREEILVIPIEGVISFGERTIVFSVEDLLQRLKKAAERPTVKAVVLRINSPGGSVAAVQEVHAAVTNLKTKGKYVVSSFGDVSASGGYYVACAGDSIITNPGTLTGSIGVLMQLPNVQGLLQKVGVSFQTLKSGSMKDAGSPFRPMTEAEREYFRSVLLDAYDQFFEAVKAGRKMDEAMLRPLADGRIFSGRMAVQRKLADGLGGLEVAIEAAKKGAGLEGKHPTVIYEKEKLRLDRLLQLFSRSPVEALRDVAPTETKLMYLMQ